MSLFDLRSPWPARPAGPPALQTAGWPVPGGARPSVAGLVVLALHLLALAALWWHGPALLARAALVPPTLRVVYAAPVIESAPPPPAPLAATADTPSTALRRPAAPAPASEPRLGPVAETPAQPLGTVALAAAEPAAEPLPAEGSAAAPAEAAPPAASAPRPVPAPATPAPRIVPPSAVSYRVPPPVQVPLASRRLGEAGTVWLKVWVDEAGLPRQVSLHRSSGHARLDEQALWAMGQARFRPQTDHGVPIEWVVIAPIAYELE